MAVRPLFIVIAGLAVLLLFIPAVAAAEGHGSAAEGRGAASSESAETKVAAALPASAGDGAGADIAAVHGDRAGLTVDRGALGSGPAPEVTRSGKRPTGVVRQALVTGTGLRGGGGRDSGPMPQGPRGGRNGGHRGPPTADPEPYAVPAQAAGEQKGQDPGRQGAAYARGRKDTSHSTVLGTDEVETPDPVLLLRFLLVLGFRRVRPGNVLEHPLRQALYRAVESDPGLDLAGCAAATGANRETLRYHLALLVCCGKVIEETRSGSVRYFPHDPTLTRVRRALLHALRNESLAPILSAIHEMPGISRHELADALGVAGPSVTRQVQRLIEEGLVESERCGRSTCYRLTPSCLAALGPSPVAGPDGSMAIDSASA